MLEGQNGWRVLSLGKKSPMRFLRPMWLKFVFAGGLFFLGASTQAADQSSTQSNDTNEDTVDMAKVQSGGTVAFVSSGKKLAVLRAIDDDRRTLFQFSDSDSHPTLIIKLNETRPVSRVSLVPESNVSQVNVYLLNEVPRNASDLDALTPTTAIVNLVVGREAAADFAPQSARYVALRWMLLSTSAGPAKVAEVSVFAASDSHHSSDLLALADPAASLQVVEPPDVPVVSP